MIGIWGDSIVYGALDNECGGWVTRLKLRLNRELGYLEVLGLGISGSTTDWLIKRFELEYTIRERVKIVVFGVGKNDALSHDVPDKPLVSLASFEANLAKISAIIDREKSPEVLWLGPANVDETKTQPWRQFKRKCYWSNTLLEEYRQVMKDFAQKQGDRYLSLQPVLEASDLAEGVHPNAQGHQKIADVVYDVLLPAIQKYHKPR